MSKFDVAGNGGILIKDNITIMLGVGYLLLPLIFVLLGVSFIKSEVPDVGWIRIISGAMFLLSGLGIIDIVSGKDAEGIYRHSGGLLGEKLSTPLVSLFDVYASIVFLCAILIISISIIFDAKLNPIPFLQKNLEHDHEEKLSYFFK